MKSGMIAHARRFVHRIAVARPSPAARRAWVGPGATVIGCRLALMSTLGAVLATASAGAALAAQTDITISMAAPPATPRILGASLIGSIPGSPLLHTISATGQAPLSFAATDLPEGLSLDATTGTISGTTPTAGSYPIQVTVTNSAGSTRRTLTLKSGTTLALTPPMGWNSYDSFYANVTEKDVLAAAQSMKTLLQPYGWNTVVIDYLWYDPEKTTDSNGRWLPSKSKYPGATGSDGFKSLAAQVHALGLSFGIHLMRGIPRKSVSANSPVADSTYTASQAGNTGDTCSWDDHMYGVRADTAAGKAWYDSIYTQYADWGVDFVKVDDMMNPYGGNVLHSTEVVAVHDSIAKTGRSIVLSLSPGPNQTKDVAVLNANANMWRTVNDFWDQNGLSSLSDEFSTAYSWSTTTGITQGHWPDADMLPLGTIGSRPCAFSHNQQVTVMTLWAIMPSPLMFGGMPTKLSGDSWTLALLTNDEVLAVNQDALGNRAKRISQQNSTEVWARDLADGRKAVALFNRGTQDATVSVTFSQLGLSGTPPVRDLWRRQDATGMSNGISVNVPHEAALIYAVGVASGGADGNDGGTGSGGATGGDGGLGRGGASGSGGSSGDSGALGGGGAAGAGGAGAGGSAPTADAGPGGSSARGGSAGSGGAGGAATGGTSAVMAGGASGASARGGATTGSGGVTASRGGAGGSNGATSSGGTGAGGASSTVGNADTANGGCSCDIGSKRRPSLAWTLAVVAIALSLRVRRRRRANGS
jgi:alpha-galactosidase